MAAKTWDGGGANENWSTQGNWNLDTVPATTDTITFDGTSTKNCTIDGLGTWSGGTFTITSAYSGTITQSVNITTAAFSKSGGTWTPSGTPTFTSTTFLLQTGGTFTQGGTFTSTTFTVAAATYVGSSSTMNTEAVVFNNSSGNITATSGNWNLGDDWTKTNSPTFSANGGTITVVDTCVFTAPTTTFNLVVITMAGADNLTIPNGTTIPLGASPTSTLSTGTLTITGTVTVSGVWTVVGTIDVSVTTGTVSGALTTLAFNRSLTIAATATFPSSVILTWTGSATAVLTATATTFGTSTVSRTAQATVAAGTTLPLGASPTTSVGTTTLIITGTVTASGLWSHTGLFTISATGTVSGGFTRLTVTNTFTVTAGGTWQAGAALTMAAILASDINASGITFGSPCIINGSTTGVVDVKSGTTFPLGTDPTVTLGVGGDLRPEGTVTASGTWTQASGVGLTMLGGGVISGTFTLVLTEASLDADAASTTWPSTGSITMNITSATSRTVALGGKTVGTFRRTGAGTGLLVMEDSATYAAFNDNDGLAAHTIRFTASTTHSAAAWDLRGSSGKLLTIESSSATNHILTTTGITNIVCANMSISNSTVDASPVWYAGATPPSVDGGGGNVNWIFTASPNAAKLRKAAVLV